MSDEKKLSILHGAALLAGATAIVKIIGAFYKIPLSAIIGAQGFSYFYTAYEIYSVLLLISTAGLPVAVSRLISQAHSMRHYNQVRQVYRISRNIFLVLGAVSSLLMTLVCRSLANFMEQPDAWFAIGCLGPCALLVCLLSAYRGVFQGQGNMIPTSVSEVLEAFFKLVVGVATAVVLLQVPRDVSYAAGGAILGVTSGCAVATVYLFILFRKAYKSLDAGDPDQPVLGYGATAKQLLAIAFPISIGSAGLQGITGLEGKVYMTQLLGNGFTQDLADSMKGIYNMAQTIFNMPCAFITPITVSAIPAIASYLTLNRHDQVRATEESASRITALISMPCAFGLATLARPVMALLGGYTGENLELAVQLMRVLGMCSIFNSTVMLTNAIMQAHGRVTLPVVNMFVGGFLKLAVIYILTGNPDINILGVPVGTVCCYICITTLNLFAMNRCIQDPPKMVRNMLRPLVAALLMSAVVILVYTLLGKVLSLDSGMGKLLLTGVPICAGAVVYIVRAIKLKAITRDDCLLQPKGEKIANLLHL